MATRYSITSEELDRLIGYINGETGINVLEDDLPQRLDRICQDMHRRMASDMKARERENAMLRGRLDRLAQRETSSRREGHFDEAGWDTAALARVIIYYFQKQGARPSWGRVNSCLFFIYATFLAKFGIRLTVDGPKAMEWGPQFWTLQGAFKKKALSTVNAVGVEAVKAVAEKDSRLVKITENTVRYLSRWSDEELCELFKRSGAWKEAVEAGHGKWGQPLDDGAIYVWRSTLVI